MPNEDSCYWKRPIPQNMPPDIAFERTADLTARYSMPFMSDVRQELRLFGYRLAIVRCLPHQRNKVAVGDVHGFTS